MDNLSTESACAGTNSKESRDGQNSNTAALRKQVEKLKQEKEEMERNLNMKECIIQDLMELEKHWKNKHVSLVEDKAKLETMLQACRRGEKRSHTGQILCRPASEKKDKSGASSKASTVKIQIVPNKIIQQIKTSHPAAVTTTERKLKEFFEFVIDLSDKTSQYLSGKVRGLVQNLIDGRINEQDFHDGLTREINMLPQLCLIPFLKQNLPGFRKGLIDGKYAIDGINPPPPHHALDLASAALSSALKLPSDTFRVCGK